MRPRSWYERLVAVWHALVPVVAVALLVLLMAWARGCGR